MKILKVFLIVSCVIFITKANDEKILNEKVYEGFKVYDISPKNQKDLNALLRLSSEDSEGSSLDFLSFHNNVNDVVSVAVNPEQIKFIESFLNKNQLEYKIKTSNLQKNIDDEFEEFKLKSQLKSETLKFDRYYRHNEINKFLDRLQNENIPNTIVRVENVGKSLEGRDIKIVKISNDDGKPKKSIFIDSTIHAREWIAPATSLYFLTELINPQSNYSKLLEKMDFIIQPVVNPDGYEFTFNRWRLWRKNRRRNGICSGVDLNRNYNYSWNTGGSSSNPCQETFHGPKGFSEIETQISRDILMNVNENDNCKFFLTLHSYGNYLLYPWGHKTVKADNFIDQEAVVKAGAKAIKDSTGTDYTTGSTAETLYAASGSSIDFAHAEAKIPISIVMELPGGGNFGFDFPASELEQACKESIIGIAAMCNEVARIYNF